MQVHFYLTSGSGNSFAPQLNNTTPFHTWPGSIIDLELAALNPLALLPYIHVISHTVHCQYPSHTVLASPFIIRMYYCLSPLTAVHFISLVL